MKLTIKTAFGFLSVQPDGSLQFRDSAGPWETFEVDGLELPAPGPTQPPHDEPWEYCAPGEDAITVTCVKTAIGPQPQTPEGAFEITKRVAWLLREFGVGLLLKPGGENIVSWQGQSFSAGRVCYSDGRLVKILTDVPTTNGPTWADNGVVDKSLYVPAIDPSLP